MRRVPSKHRNRLAARQKEQEALGRLALVLLCGLVLASGFVYAGVQHFGALRLGYETEKLRADLAKAQEEQKRLFMAREAAVSPIRLEQAARRLGMQPMAASQLDPLKQRSEITEVKAAPTAQRMQTPEIKQSVGAAANDLKLKSSRPAAMPVAKHPTTAALKPVSIKVQEKAKTSKASSDQKKSR